MGLGVCPECWQKVSREARVCPRCGHPLRRRSVWVIGLWVLAVLTLLALPGVLVLWQVVRFYAEYFVGLGR